VKLTALAVHTPEAVRAALAARGWETQPAWFAATGMQALVVLLEEITEAEREGLVRWGAKAGADVLTGAGWALVGAPASRLAPLARPDRLPPGLERLAPELGRFLASYRRPAAPLGPGWEQRSEPRSSRAHRHRECDAGLLLRWRPLRDCRSGGGPGGAAGGGRVRAAGRGGRVHAAGRRAVMAEEEIGRVAPVIEQLVRRGLGPVSVDTRKAAVARAALNRRGRSGERRVGARVRCGARERGKRRRGRNDPDAHARTPDTMDSLAVYRHVRRRWRRSWVLRRPGRRQGV